jgi:mRNA-degrading endonuclease RelE of RelBE toxin-antitoxin system
MEIFTTDKFEIEYNKLPKSVQKKAQKQEKLFQNNLHHPSLHIEKLSPKWKEMWSFRIDKNYRIVFRFLDKDKVLFLNAGPHDWIYKIKF